MLIMQQLLFFSCEQVDREGTVCGCHLMCYHDDVEHHVWKMFEISAQHGTAISVVDAACKSSPYAPGLGGFIHLGATSRSSFGST